MHFARKLYNNIGHFGRKAYHNVVHFGKKAYHATPKILQHIEHGAQLAERYGQAIGHERLAAAGNHYATGPLISHEAQRNIINKGFAVVDKYV